MGQTNDYEAAAEREEPYQMLHFSSRQEKHGAAAGSAPLVSPPKKPLVLLLGFIVILLLTITLVFVILHYHHFRLASHAAALPSTGPTTGPDHQYTENNEEDEVWHLHDNVFYLLSKERTNCEDAVRFCRERNASLALSENLDWMRHKIDGQQLWVRDNTWMNEYFFVFQLCPCSVFPLDYNSLCYKEYAWVCEKRGETTAPGENPTTTPTWYSYEYLTRDTVGWEDQY